MRRILFLSALLVSSVAATAVLQDEWTRGAIDRLYLVLSRDGREGGRLLAPAATGVLYQEGIAEQAVRLEAGEHLIVATCDTGCDLDVRAFSGDGRPVATDADEHPHAIADLQVREPGTYRVQATMAACIAEPCHYAVGVFRVEP